VQLALKVLERVAVLQETASAGSIHATKYLLLRLALVRSICRCRSTLTYCSQAWQQDRLDLADHFFAKLQAQVARPTAADTLDCVELSFEIGRDCLGKRLDETAVKWLGRAAGCFQIHDIAGHDTENLQLNVLHAYARALLALEDAETGVPRAREVVEMIQRVRSSQFLTLTRLTRVEIWRQFRSLTTPA
jgi:hypothetical protein